MSSILRMTLAMLFKKVTRVENGVAVGMKADELRLKKGKPDVRELILIEV